MLNGKVSVFRRNSLKNDHGGKGCELVYLVSMCSWPYCLLWCLLAPYSLVLLCVKAPCLVAVFPLYFILNALVPNCFISLPFLCLFFETWSVCNPIKGTIRARCHFKEASSTWSGWLSCPWPYGRCSVLCWHEYTVSSLRGRFAQLERLERKFFRALSFFFFFFFFFFYFPKVFFSIIRKLIWFFSSPTSLFLHSFNHFSLLLFLLFFILFFSFISFVHSFHSNFFWIFLPTFFFFFCFV